MKELNLCEILKGHEGETFYSPAFGNIKLNCITGIIYFESIDGKVSFDLYPNGTYCLNGELIIFPSKDQRDWNKWLEEQKSKVPKTWSELNHYPKYENDDYSVDITGHCGNGITRRDTPIEKSALALLKIHQLIELSYGGNITNEEWLDRYTNLTTKWVIVSNDDNGDFLVIETQNNHMRTNPAFHTQEQAEEFLTHPENIQLLKDYFII